MKDIEARETERYEMLRAEMGHLFNDPKETIRDSQAGLLTAFYYYAQSTDFKLKDSEDNGANIFSVEKRRITELYRKVNFPRRPAQ